MKVAVVVDSISGLTNKIEKLTKYFGDDMCFVVNSNFVKLFKTYGYKVDAVYTNQCSNVLHLLLNNFKKDDTVIYYTSLNLDDGLLNKFTSTIGDKQSAVALCPTYNWFERVSNKLYNAYVNNIFSYHDSLYSKKLQFLPKAQVENLIQTHIGNRLFIKPDDKVKEIITNDKTVNKGWKQRNKNLKPLILGLIVALSITLLFVISLTVFEVKYIFVVLFVMMYLLDITICTIYSFKLRFDDRFLR